MPRIDPIQLLNCLSVLLSPDGGIKSRDEVQRLASLMTKFSKKLVSKCIYIQILKCTETSLLGLFMGSGGWRLIHMWLTESIVAKNWPLVRELLELLLLCPVDIERLKTNNCPKLVKELSKDGNHIAIRALASKLVEQWLKTVKGEHVAPIKNNDIPKIINDAQLELNPVVLVKNDAHTQLECGNKIKNEVKSELDVEHTVKTDKLSEVTDKTDNSLILVKKEVDDNKPELNSELKSNIKNDKVAASPTQDDAENKLSEKSSEKVKVHDKDRKSDRDKSDKEKSKDKHKSKHKDRSSSKSDSSSSKSSSSKSSSHSSSSEKHKSSHKRNDSPSPRSSKDKSKERDKHSSSSKSKHSESNNKKSSDKIERSNSSSSSKTKEDRNVKTSEKDRSKDKVKDASSVKPISENKIEQKPEPPSIQKLGKIPKLSDKKEKPSISIEVRKPDEPKPKTVKTFHSRFRKHGLEEEIKPPPSRAAVLNKKVTPIVPPPAASIPKRPSPVHNETPPEKKPKTVEIVEKPGAIKLIPPKPKPMMLLESDMFMSALNASATNKKEPKKRKRRTSGSKDGNAPGDNSPPHTPTTVTSPNGENKSVPPNFYQDTLDTEEEKEKTAENSSDSNENVESTNVTEKAEPKPEEPMEITEPHTLTVNGLKGVLCYHKRKGPKKSIKWRPDSELEEIQYFELDETERVNVTKTFTDMKYLERIHERDAFQKGRNLANDDVMEEKTSWAHLIPIDLDGQIEVEYGKNSKEKDIQAIRQKGTLQPLYFHKAMIPDSALEPDTETHTYSEPTVIPLEDVTGNQDNISDFRNMPWPEPKGNAPPASSNINVAPMFPPQFPGGFPPAQFPGMPGFQGPNMVPGDWQNGVPPHIIANGMPMPLTPNALVPGGMPPVNMPPGMLVPPESMMMGPEMFGGPNPLFPGPPEGFGMPQNMFPPDFNMSGPVGPPGPEGFPGPDTFPGTDGFSGPNNFRGSTRGRGSGGHWRGKNSGNWDGPQRGRGGSRGSRKAVCIYFQRKGSCRQGDNCAFLHPGVNCPY